MHRYAYFIALIVVSISICATIITFALTLLGLNMLFGGLFTVFGVFASPLPAPLQYPLPTIVRIALFFTFAALVARRLWLLTRSKPAMPPSSLSRWPGHLLSVAVISLSLMVLGLALSAAIRAGSGVPAAFLGLPAIILLTPVLFYVELRSLSWFSVRGNGT